MTNKITNPLQESDDRHYMDQPGSEAGMPETLIHEDSPEVSRDDVKMGAVEKVVKDPINANRDDLEIDATDKDENLHSQFVDTVAIDAQPRK